MDAWIGVVVSAVVAFITALIAAPLRLSVDTKLLRRRLEAEHEYEQRRELSQLIGRYHGRLVEAAEQLHFRLGNIYDHDPDRWLANPEGFFLRTTCYRLLALVGLSRAFEKEAHYIDARIAARSDLDFLRYVKAFFWALTSTPLFRGLPHDETYAVDHFFADQLRNMAEEFCPKGTPISYKEFSAELDRHPNEFEDALSFCLGLMKDEERLRWDRLVVLHLFVIGFLNSAGYPFHKSSDDEIKQVVGQIRHEQIKRNLHDRLPRLDLDSQADMLRISRLIVGQSG